MTSLQNEPAVQNGRQQASPALMFETLNRYQHTMALKGAIELDLFSHIGQGADTSSKLSARCQASERGVRILCDFLTVLGFLNKADGRYTLTQDSALFLDRQSPAYAGSIAEFIASPKVMTRFQDVAALVRKGGTLDGAGMMEPENDVWVDFARHMAPIAAGVARAAAPVLSEPGRKIKVLDIAAGHGMFGITIARQNPAAEIVALDWQKVVKVAERNAAEAGVGDRFRTITGDAFHAALGNDYDLVLISNFLHHFDEKTNVRLLKKLRAALRPDGKLATVEFVPNQDRVSPPIPASFSMVMLGSTEHGDAYTLAEFEQMFRSAGFGTSTLQPLPPTPFSLIVTSR